MNDMEIRLANSKDINNVIEFYKVLCEDPNNKALWKYGLYPTDEDLLNDINNQTLYVLIDDDEIVSAGVIQMKEDELYNDINWTRHNPAVVHILATLPHRQHKGYAKKLLMYLIELAKSNNRDSIHLDIVYDNDYARKLYEDVGFIKVEDKELYYPDTGAILSTLFEYKIMLPNNR